MAVIDRPASGGRVHSCAVIELVAAHAGGARREIEEAEGVGTPESLSRTAELLRSYVLSTPRTQVGVGWLQLRVERMIHIDPAGALGLHLAQRLVICGVHLDCLEGSEWTTGFDQLDRLQVLLQGFMHRRGVAAWPGAYGDVRGFNKVKAGVHERPGCC